MFYDLNVPWTTTNDPELPRKLAFLADLGYNVVALNHAITGKMPASPTCAIPDQLPFPLPAKLQILRRCTFSLTEPVGNSRLTALGSHYDILALRPVDEKTFQNACNNLESDLISLDLSQRLPFYFKFTTVAEAVKRGVRFEICYAQGLLGDAGARRNLISNATQLVRATRGRGIIVSSEARRALGCRGPWDVVNLVSIWGLAQDRGYEAVSKEARGVVVAAKMARTGYRGVVDVVYGGEKPVLVPAEAGKVSVVKAAAAAASQGTKRKVEAIDSPDSEAKKPMSNRQKKKQAAQARKEAVNQGDELKRPIETEQADKLPT